MYILLQSLKLICYSPEFRYYEIVVTPYHNLTLPEQNDLKTFFFLKSYIQKQVW